MCEPQRRADNKQWKRKDQKRPCIAKRAISSKKMLYAIFFNSSGPVVPVPCPSEHTVTGRFYKKEVREKSRECHNHKPQPFPDPRRKRKPTNPNKHKPNKRMKSTKISSLFPKLGNRNTKRTEKHKNKMTHGKTYNKSPRRIKHKATQSKTNTGTTALERSVEQTKNSVLKKVKEFYNKKRPSKGWSGVHLLHDNASSHKV